MLHQVNYQSSDVNRVWIVARLVFLREIITIPKMQSTDSTVMARTAGRVAPGKGRKCAC